MKIFLFTFLLCSVAVANNIQGVQNYKSFKEAKKAESQLKFTVESTKVGLFSSDVDGYVKQFRYKANQKQDTIQNMEVVFDVMQMDTDNSSRDEKLHNKCLSHEEYSYLLIHIDGPLKIEGEAKTLKGWVEIRGKKKDFVINIKAKKEENTLMVEGDSVWKLSEMEIPDPSIAIAKLSDEIRIKIKIKHDLKK